MLERKPLVSVVLPTYNAQNHLLRALKSVAAQTYRPLELIVVDDGSFDNTVHDAFKYMAIPNAWVENGKENVRFRLFQQPNMGPSRARNRGIVESAGNYVAFLDADDYWDDDKITAQLTFLQAFPEIDIVVTDALIVRKSGSRKDVFNLYDKYNLGQDFFGHERNILNPFKKLLLTNFIPTSSLLAKKKCFSGEYKFNELIRHAEDLELWLKLARHCTFGYINTALVVKEEDGKGLSADHSTMITSVVRVKEAALSDSSNTLPDDLSHAWAKNYLALTYKWAGYHFLKIGNSKDALQYFISSLKMRIELKPFLYTLFSLAMMAFPTVWTWYSKKHSTHTKG